MKKIALALTMTMFAGSSAFAGNAAPVANDAPLEVMEKAEGSMGSGSGGWILPVIAIAALAVVATNGD